jgi:CheY-like chemotaxis protein
VKRILIVDDSAIMRRQIRKLLEVPCEVEICAEASSGVEALQKVQECHPDLVVLDLVMPGMNGLEATRKIKMLLPTLPVLLFTFDESPEIERQGHLAGADAVLTKSEGAAQLRWTVVRLL